ncbi:hypothetical protein CsatA_010940 [Cannabis sativa]
MPPPLSASTLQHPSIFEGKCHNFKTQKYRSIGRRIARKTFSYYRHMMVRGQVMQASLLVTLF